MREAFGSQTAVRQCTRQNRDCGTSHTVENLRRQPDNYSFL